MESEKELKIFITDDDVFSLSINEQHVKNLGVENVSLFSNGNDCLNNLHQKPDIIFLDHNMEGLSGAEVLKKIKRVDPDIYIVMISAQENIATAVGTLKYGAFDYIVKDEHIEKHIRDVVARILFVREQLRKNKTRLTRRLFSLF
jgi:DNA-binding NtrC family response regulator